MLGEDSKNLLDTTTGSRRQDCFNKISPTPSYCSEILSPRCFVRMVLRGVRFSGRTGIGDGGP